MQFIYQNVHCKLDNIWNQNLNFIVKIIPNQEYFFYLIAYRSTKRAIPIISGRLIVSTKFYN